MAPKKRRQYRSGGISLRKDGLWMGRIDAGTYPNGKRRQVCVYGKTEAEAKAKLERKKKQIAAEGNAVAAKTRATVRSWATTWLAAREHKSRPNAHSADRSAVNNWILPTIGQRRLENLTPDDVRAVADAQRAAGRKASSRLRTHRTLMKMLKDAVVDGHDVPRAALAVEAPSKGNTDRDALDIEHAVAVLAVAAELPHGSRWATALLQGMRPSECLGLTWSAVDFDRNLIRVEWQLQTLRYIDPTNKSLGFRVPDDYKVRHLVDAYHLVELKTDAGYRIIPMVPWIRDALLAWREIAPPNPHDLVWPNAKGRPANTTYDDQEWDALQCTAEVGHPAGRYYVRHEARHTTATLLLEAGIDPKVVQAIMGQSSMVATRGYQHVKTELALAALEQVAHKLELRPAAAAIG